MKIYNNICMVFFLVNVLSFSLHIFQVTVLVILQDRYSVWFFQVSVHYRQPSINYIYNVTSPTSKHDECLCCTPYDYIISLTYYRCQHRMVSNQDGMSAHTTCFSWMLGSSIVHIVVLSQLRQPRNNNDVTMA